MKKIAALGLAFVLTFANGARAQDEPPRPDPAADDERRLSDDDPVAKPAPEPDPEPVVGVRYRVSLKSGRLLEGVVRAKSIFERRARTGGYEPADDSDVNAGIRVWFPANQDGFIFMRLTAILRMDELGSLSVAEGKSIARARVASRRRADSERVQLAAARIAAEKAEAAAAAEAEAVETEAIASTKPRDERDGEADAADEQVLASLLIKYPPTRWSPESPAEIERRKVVLGLFPSVEETAFLDVFDDWLRAYNAWRTTNDEETVSAKRPTKAKRPKARSPRGRPTVDRPETPTWK